LSAPRRLRPFSSLPDLSQTLISSVDVPMLIQMRYDYFTKDRLWTEI